MKHSCLECGYSTLAYLPATDEYRCSQCKWRVTGQMLQELEYKPYGPQEKMFGLFQIHASPLVPPGQIYLFSDIVMQQHQILYGEPKPKEKSFDYKERASVEFNLDNESGLR